MSNRHDTLFELLDPPPGGAQRLRALLLAAPHAAEQPPRWTGAASLATLTALLGAIYFGIALPPMPLVTAGSGAATRIEPASDIAEGLLASPALDGLLGRIPLEAALSVRIDDRTVETEELPSSDPKVRIYRML
jgi:hypothetical protein